MGRLSESDCHPNVIGTRRACSGDTRFLRHHFLPEIAGAKADNENRPMWTSAMTGQLPGLLRLQHQAETTPPHLDDAP